jgi:membrane-associated protease RseP (regulator of RpoE activity)
VKQHALLSLPGPSLDVTGGGFGGTFTSTMRRMKSVSLGGFTVPEPLVGLSHANSGGFASEDYAGNIGNRLLDRFHVTLDYERRTLWLAPGRRFAERDVFPRAGVQLLKQDGTVRAATVLPGSPAADAGVLEGDEVVAIDGTPAGEWDPERVRDALDQGAIGSRHTIEVKRDGGPQKLTLILKELL